MRDISNSSFINYISMSPVMLPLPKLEHFYPVWVLINSTLIPVLYLHATMHCLPISLFGWLHFIIISFPVFDASRWRMTDGGVSFKGLSYFVGIGGYRVIPSIPRVWRAGSVAFCPHPVTWWYWISSHIAGCYWTISFFHLTHFFHKKQVLM